MHENWKSYKPDATFDHINSLPTNDHIIQIASMLDGSMTFDDDVDNHSYF